MLEKYLCVSLLGLTWLLESWQPRKTFFPPLFFFFSSDNCFPSWSSSEEPWRGFSDKEVIHEDIIWEESTWWGWERVWECKRGGKSREGFWGRAGDASVKPTAIGKWGLRTALPHRFRYLACTKIFCLGYQSPDRSFFFYSALDCIKIIKEDYFWRLPAEKSFCAPVPARQRAAAPEPHRHLSIPCLERGHHNFRLYSALLFGWFELGPPSSGVSQQL